MRLGKTKNYFNSKFSLLIISFVFFISVLIGFVLRNLYYPFESAVAAYATKTGNECIYNSVKKCITNKVIYSDIIHIKENQSGEITLLSADTLKIAALKTEIINEIEKNISSCSKNKIILRAGAAQSNPIFSAFGPAFVIKVNPDVIISAEFRDNFTSKGINNIRHTIYIDTEILFTVSSSFYKKTFTISDSVPIADTVISGKIPEYYGSFSGGHVFNENS